MSDEMVERVARALAPLAWAALGTGDTLAQKNRRAASLRHARTAIEAMREHSPEQEKRMRIVLGEATPATSRWHWVWHEMIDAALSITDPLPDGEKTL